MRPARERYYSFPRRPFSFSSRLIRDVVQNHHRNCFIPTKVHIYYVYLCIVMIIIDYFLQVSVIYIITLAVRCLLNHASAPACSSTITIIIVMYKVIKLWVSARAEIIVRHRFGTKDFMHIARDVGSLKCNAWKYFFIFSSVFHFFSASYCIQTLLFNRIITFLRDIIITVPSAIFISRNIV